MAQCRASLPILLLFAVSDTAAGGNKVHKARRNTETNYLIFIYQTFATGIGLICCLAGSRRSNRCALGFWNVSQAGNAFHSTGFAFLESGLD